MSRFSLLARLGLFGYFVFETYGASALLRLCWDRSGCRNSGCGGGDCGVFEEGLRAGDALGEGLGLAFVCCKELKETKMAA